MGAANCSGHATTTRTETRKRCRSGFTMKNLQYRSEAKPYLITRLGHESTKKDAGRATSHVGHTVHVRRKKPLIQAHRPLLLSLLVFVAGVAWSSCSDDHLLAPPTEIFPLPSDAPSDAAAAPGTTRVLVTAIQIFTPDGRVANPAALQGNANDRFKAWIFCPRGLEGAFDYAVPSIRLSGSGLQAKPGYNDVSGSVSIQATPGASLFRFDVIREYVTIASKEITLVVTP